MSNPKNTLGKNMGLTLATKLYFSILVPKCPSLIYEQWTDILHQQLPSVCVKEMANIDKFDITLYYK